MTKNGESALVSAPPLQLLAIWCYLVNSVQPIVRYLQVSVNPAALCGLVREHVRARINLATEEHTRRVGREAVEHLIHFGNEKRVEEL